MPPIGQKKITLQFPVNWLILIGIVALALILLFIFGDPDWRPPLIFTTAVIAGAAGLTTAINALDARVALTNQAKLLGTLTFMDKWNNPAFQNCKQCGREMVEFIRKTQSVDAQIAHLMSDQARLSHLFDVLNLFEALAIAIETECAEDKTARKFFRSVVVEYWHTMEAFIKKRRAERGNVRLYREFESLYGRWKD